MAFRSVLCFLCTFGFLFMPAELCLAQQDTASTTAAKQQQPASKQKEEEILKRESKAMTLLEEVVSAAQSLKLPENSIRVQIAAGDIFWARDEARARTLFDQAAASIAQVNGNIAAADSDQLENMARLRRELVLIAAQHNTELGFHLLNSTRPPARSETNSNETNASTDETSLAESLLSIIASHDPQAAYQKSLDSLDRGEYPAAIASVLRQLYLKDKEQFEKLSKKVLSKLTSNNLMASEEAGNLAVDLLSPGPISENAKTKSQSSQIPGQKPALSESAYRDLMEATIAAALTGGENITPHAQGVVSLVRVDFTTSVRGMIMFSGDDVGSGIFLQPISTAQPDDEQTRQQNARRLLSKLQPLLARIDQYLPDRAQAVRQKSTELELNNNQLTSIDLNQSTSESLMTTASLAPTQLQPQIYKQAAQKAIDEGLLDRALQIATDHLDGSTRNTIMQVVDLKRTSVDGSPDTLARFRQKLAALPTDAARVMAIIDVARAAAKDNPKLGLILLEDARALVSKRASKYQDFIAQITVAEAFAGFDLKQSFDVLDPGIAQLNEIIAAAAVVDGFEAQVFREGEIPLHGGSELVRMLARYGWALGSLAKLDFNNARATADKFQLPEARLWVKLFIARRVLGGQENPFDGKPPD